MQATKTIAPLVGFPYLGPSELEGRLPYALNREFFICTHPKFELAQSGGYPRGPQRPSRRATTLGIFISGGPAMSNNQNGVENSSKNTTPIDLLETIQSKNHALRALGALLSTAKLSSFDTESCIQGSQAMFEIENMQYGLSKLIDLYIDDLEQTIEKFADEYEKSDESRIKSVLFLIKLSEEGAWPEGRIPIERNFARPWVTLKPSLPGTAPFSDRWLRK